MKMKKFILILLSAILIISSLAGCEMLFQEFERAMEAGVAPDALQFSQDTLRVNYIDVGQGDSIFVQYPNGEVMLIDAAKKKDVGAVVDFLNSRDIKKIDYLVATHPHEDHIGGMATIIDTFDIGKIYMPKKEHDTKTYLNMLESIQRKKLKISTAKAGVEIANAGGCHTYIISPTGDDYKELNDYSAVIRIEYGGTSFLFMGDAETLIEKELMAKKSLNLKADVLKVGHHGSNTSSSNAFLKAVSPTHAIVCVGDNNDYGHPKENVVKRYENLKINLYRTDKDGTVTAVSDGNEVQIYTHVQ